MKEIKIEELEKINDYIESKEIIIGLGDVLCAIEELSYKHQRNVTADEIIECLDGV